jgi:hypothetical protein
LNEQLFAAGADRHANAANLILANIGFESRTVGSDSLFFFIGGEAINPSILIAGSNPFSMCWIGASTVDRWQAAIAIEISTRVRSRSPDLYRSATATS